MQEIFKTTILGLIFGFIGTAFGGIIGANLKISSKKIMGFVLEISAGLMTSIICFELIPEALNIVNLNYCLFGVILGLICMFICDKIASKSINNKINSLLKTGMIVGIGLPIHNFPEGLAIGSGFGSSEKLGLTLALAIAFHDIPEGMSMAVPLKNGGMSKRKVIFYTMISGLSTGIGAFLGGVVGKIDISLIGISLAFAAGAMIYIVSAEIIPESKRIYNGKLSAFGNIFGFILGVVAMQI